MNKFKINAIEGKSYIIITNRKFMEVIEEIMNHKVTTWELNTPIRNMDNTRTTKIGIISDKVIDVEYLV